MAACHRGGKGAVVWKFAGIDTPEDAEALRGIVFLADRKFLDGPDEGVLYFEDFEGCEIADEQGQSSRSCGGHVRSRRKRRYRHPRAGGRRVAHARNARGRIEARGRALDFPSP